MFKRLATLGVAAAACALLAAPATGVNTSPGGTPLSTTLTGAAERPGPGDPDGTGTAKLRLNSGRGLICYRITYANIVTPLTGAHIHRAPPTDPGPIVVPLDQGPSPIVGCARADRQLIKAIRKHPEQYYVNLHNAPFLAGAIRGQLSKGH